MARIAGIDIPRDKQIVISLTYIYGIGLTTSKEILAAAGVAENIRTKDLTEEQLKMVASGFALGMGCMESTCGALIGANIVLGLLNKTGKRTNSYSNELLKDFEELSGATQCKVLKGIETGKVLSSCNDCVKNACIALNKELEKIGVDLSA